MLFPALKPTPGFPTADPPLQRTCLLFIFIAGLLGLAGCGSQQLRPTGVTVAANLTGSVHGGQQPIAGATIELFAVGSAGDGSASTPLLTTTEVTDSRGNFNVGPYSCPSASTNLYLAATGGNPGLAIGQTNPDTILMVALGPCGSVTSSTFVNVNEVTTVATVYALAPFLKSYKQVGSGSLDAQAMADAFTLASEMVNTGKGVAPGTGVPNGQTVPIQKINALANIVSTCVHSSGGIAGDGSACGSLFSLATPAGGTPPKDTTDALLNIAKTPTAEVVPIYLLSPPTAPFEPTLISAPTDWTLPLSSPTASPTFSPTPGTYAVSPAITLSDTSSGAQIYYTTDGSIPTISSHLYSGAISLPATGIVRALAVAAGMSSLPVSGVYTLNVPPTIALSPSSVGLTQAQTQPFTATVSGLSNTAVTWAISPNVGSLSPAGVYTAPAAIQTTQTVSISATSVADPLIVADSSITLLPAVSVSLTPSTVTLTGSQNQAFSTNVTNTSNTNVTWSMSPALGTVSAAGFYTAPASISETQTVTLTATSVGDPSASASAKIVLAPSTGLTYYVSNSGSDSNNGTSSASPWQTIAHVNAQTLKPGDSVLFQAEGTWREQLNNTWTGSPTSPITFGSYGTGTPPIISGADVFSSWSSEAATERAPNEICSNSLNEVTSVPCAAQITTAGSLLVIQVYTNTGEPASLTDWKGNTFLPINTARLRSGSNWVQTFYVAANTGSGLDTITATVPSATLARIVAIEWPSAVSSAPLDGSNAVSLQSGTFASTGASSGNSANLNDLVLGLCAASNPLTVGSAYSAVDSFQPGGINTLLQWKFGPGDSTATCGQFPSGLWTASVVTFKAAPVNGSLYFTSYTSAPSQVFLNATRLTQALTKASLSTGQWWLDMVNHRIYVFDNPNGQTVEADQRAYGIYSPCSYNSYLTVTGLQLREAQVHGLYACGAGIWTLSRIIATNNNNAGVRLDGPAAGSSVTYSTAAYNGASGFDFYASPNILVAYDTAYNNVANPGNLYAAGIKLEPSPATTNAIVEYSAAYSNGLGQTGVTGSGIWADTIGDGLVIRYNSVSGNNEKGLDIDSDNYALVYGNLAYNNVSSGIAAYADGSSSMIGNRIYSNTVWGNGSGIKVQGPSAGSLPGGCEANSVTNNIIGASSSGPELLVQFGCENPGLNGLGNTFTYNSIGIARTNFIQWAATTTFSSYSAWETATGNCGTEGCSHSMMSNPKLTNPSGGVFTLEFGSPALGAGSEGLDLGAIPYAAP